MDRLPMTLGALGVLAMTAAPAAAQTALNPAKEDLPAGQKIYSPYVERTARNRNFAEGVYWGDTHLHTSLSSDSGMIGNRLGPDEAYRFARGEEVISSTGQRARLIRPLDFLVVSDHAEALGLAPFIAEGNPDLLATENGKRWYDMVNAGEGYEAFREWGAYMFKGDPIKSPKMQRTVWDRQIEAADRHNDPGSFTALIGFEWTSLNTEEAPSNLHRVVIFKDDGDKSRRDRSVFGLRFARSRGSLEVHAGLRGRHRRQRSGDPAQWQPVERPDVRHRAA